MHADLNKPALHADRNVRLLQRHAVCINMCFIVPIIIPYYRDRMGLGFDDFLLGEAAFAATLGAGALCAMRLHEPERHRRATVRHPLADMLETARYALSGHVELGLVIVFAALMFSATKVVMWSQQPYYMAMGLGEHVYGLLMAAGFVLGGASSHFAHLLDGRVSNLKALLGVWLLGVVCCTLASVSLGVLGGWPGAVLLMLAGTCLYGLAAPRVSEVVNRHVGSERRATVLSTQSLLCALVFMPLSLLMGRAEKDHGVDGMLLGMALWLCLAGLCLLLWCLRRRLRARRTTVQRRRLVAAFAAVV